MNKKERRNMISPFHNLLAVILAFPIFGTKAVFLVPILIISSLYHYWMRTKENNIGIKEAFKEDMPDINFFHVFMFLLILFPLWYPFVSANFCNETPVKKETPLKAEFLKRKESTFFKKDTFSKDLFYRISTYSNREVEQFLNAIKKSDTLEAYLNEIGYEVVVIPLEKFETLNKKEFPCTSSSFSNLNGVINEKKIYYNFTKIYLTDGYLKDLELRFKEEKRK